MVNVNRFVLRIGLLTAVRINILIFLRPTSSRRTHNRLNISRITVTPFQCRRRVLLVHPRWTCWLFNYISSFTSRHRRVWSCILCIGRLRSLIKWFLANIGFSHFELSLVSSERCLWVSWVLPGNIWFFLLRPIVNVIILTLSSLFAVRWKNSWSSSLIGR